MVGEGDVSDLDDAIAELREKLPGWWFTVGECSVSCDATVGPDAAYCPAWMLNDPELDAGIDGDLRQPSTMADALRNATGIALAKVTALTPTGMDGEK